MILSIFSFRPVKSDAPKKGAETDKIKEEEVNKGELAYLSEPINQATKLLMDLDEHIKSYLNPTNAETSTLSYNIQSESDQSKGQTQSQPSRQDQQEQLAPMITQLDTTIVAMDVSITKLAN